MTTRMMGEPIRRVEDRRLLTGNGRYLDDLGADAVEVAVLRSPHAHARILDIDVTGALEAPGLLAIYTYEDLTGPLADPLPLLIPHPALTHGRTQYPLARDEVNYVGEAVAMVVAENRYLAEDAVERIVVSYEVLPPVVGLAAARAAERLVHPDVPDNVAAHFVQEVGEVAAVAAQQAVVLAALDAAPDERRPGRHGLVHGRHALASRRISAARRTDATMFWYPVHRQRLPAIASRASSSVGSGFSSR